MISSNSRYADLTPVIVTGSDGKTRNVIPPEGPMVVSATVTEYIWREGDRVDLVAYRNYGDAALWWRIADVNPQIMDWTELPAGTRIRIPIV
ncbi:tail protein X [Streptomyces sp. NPDC004528]|uniref:tail protein X n=1 Tax=Streptomyces sp. NPDC004528 TaxID=3154550 RepID=UPI0033A4B44F